jgi:hypothetical protein
MTFQSFIDIADAAIILVPLAIALAFATGFATHRRAAH